MCYPNTTVTAAHKLSPCSTWCVLLGYSVDHKGYHCLDLSTNHLIVSQHVVFDEDSFPLAASPSLTDLDFLCESGPTDSTIGTHLTTAGTSTPTSRWPAPEIPPGFEPTVAPLPAPTVPLGFLPRAATTAAPPAGTDGPPPLHGRPHRLPTSGGSRGTRGAPGAALRWEAGAGTQATRGALGAALSQEVGAGPVGTRGALRAAVRREARARAAGTRGAPGATLRREVGAGATGTRGTPRATLSREVGAGPTGTHGAPRAALRREAGAGVQATHGALGATLSREAGTTPPPPLPRPSVGGQGVVVLVMPQIIHIR
jgi:hypothetical protein